jgi:error-prone DNA polymerase
VSWDDAVDGVDRETPGGRAPRAVRMAQRVQAYAAHAANDDPRDDAPPYAELHCVSDFSFLRGAASAEELFERAALCGYEALAITDECSLAGIVRANDAAKVAGIKLIVGAEFRLEDGLRCVLLVERMAGYQRLCRLITIARRAAEKGRYRLTRTDVEALAGSQGIDGLFALWLPARVSDPEQGAWLRTIFGERAYLAVELHRDTDDAARLAQLLALAEALGLVPVAAGDVHMATRRQRALQDTVTAIRHGVTLAEGGAHLFRNGERHLRTRRALRNVYAVDGDRPQRLLENAVALARRCTFSMEEVRYEYPKELVPEGHTPTTWLRELTLRGMRKRWPHGAPVKIRADIENELALIEELRYEAFFLTVQDIVAFAESKGILCQGRGSSANSAVCYALGITAVDPEHTRLLISRFLSRARNEPPDIDVDFEHERREEVMQYVYTKYGRERAALAATVVRYRGKSAVRDVAKAFGMPPDQIGLLAECYGWGNAGTEMSQRISESGFDMDNPLVRRVLAVTEMLEGRPRHLSQHVGGFVISDTPLWNMVPVENASMDDRTVIQWEKDDLESLGLLKVDCLALGMLTCIRKALELVKNHRGQEYTLATLPKEDAKTYAMIQRADTVGVFQIESRAQMTMLPRLKPAKFYDLVVEVAIVRPGPIQGGMVHPYLQRRMGKQAITYPSEGIREILEPTLGVPLFQEQVMELVIHAGYAPHEADELRRSMAAWRHGGNMEPHRIRIRELMEDKGYDSAFIDQIFEQIKGFGSYGFPQSHAASFAKLVYASCWLKCHEPAAFACALLNAQPMGFYAPSQIVQDARRGGMPQREPVGFLPVDVVHSDWDYTLVDRDCDDDVRRSDPGSGPGQAVSRELLRIKSSRLTSLLQSGSKEARASQHIRIERGHGTGSRDFRRSHNRDSDSTRELGHHRDHDCDSASFDEAGAPGFSDDNSREAGTKPQPLIRMGLRSIRGLSEADGHAIVAARAQAPFRSVADLCQRARLDEKARAALAEAGALRTLAGNRHEARWQVAGVERGRPLLPGSAPEDAVTLPAPRAGEDVLSDYRSLGLTLSAHPMSLLRARMRAQRILGSRELETRRHGSHVRAAGLVTQRQRPATAKGTIFVTLEDEHGMVNVVVWADLAARRRKALLGARLLLARGRWEQVDGVRHLVASDLEDMSAMLGALHAESRDFR